MELIFWPDHIGGLSSADILQTRGKEEFFICGRPHFLVQKRRIFRNLWCVRMDKERRLSQCGHFADNGEGSIFRDFVRTSFMDSP